MITLNPAIAKISTKISASAPGRICLFGEHQDYLGMSVIAAAISLRVTLEAKANEVGIFRISLPDIGEIVTIDPKADIRYRHSRDYLASAVNVMKRDGITWPVGYDVFVHGEIPINSGASSSSALQIAWCSLLLAAAGDDRASDPMIVAQYAHRSEVTEFNSPGGMMDHYTTAVGGIIHLDCNTTEVTPLPSWPSEFILVDSGIPKDTNGTLGATRALVEGLDVAFETLPLRLEDIPQSICNALSPTQQPVFQANIRNREYTHDAVELLRNTHDHAGLGSLLNQHQHQLSKNLGVSLPEIDNLISEGMQHGALGGKINGSGCGGSFFLYCPGHSRELLDFYRAKGLRAWRIEVGDGLRIKTDS
ncbi:galactokinase [soil metagenome]